MPEEPLYPSLLRDLLASLAASTLPPAPAGNLVRLPGAASDYGEALERSARNLLQRQIALDRERSEAEVLADRLLRYAPERQALLLRNDCRFHTWGVLERLLEKSREQVLTARRESERLALLALTQSGLLDEEYYGASRIEDLRARAWSCIAESRRLRSDFGGAEAALAEAHAHLRAGTGDPLERAVIYDSQAALRRCQRRFAEAERLLRRAIEIFVDNGEEQGAGQSLVGLAAVHAAAGHPEMALPLLEEALRRIDGGREPRLLLRAQHHKALCLTAAGRLMEARGLLIRNRPLYRQLPDAWTQSHLRWLRGKLSLACGQLAEAEAELLAAREGFLSLESPFEAALAALDLAGVHARQERPADLRRTAGDALAAFRSLGVEPEARAAQALLDQAEEIGEDCLEPAEVLLS